MSCFPQEDQAEFLVKRRLGEDAFRILWFRHCGERGARFGGLLRTKSCGREVLALAVWRRCLLFLCCLCLEHSCASSYTPSFALYHSCQLGFSFTRVAVVHSPCVHVVTAGPFTSPVTAIQRHWSQMQPRKMTENLARGNNY